MATREMQKAVGELRFSRLHPDKFYRTTLYGKELERHDAFHEILNTVPYTSKDMEDHPLAGLTVGEIMDRKNVALQDLHLLKNAAKYGGGSANRQLAILLTAKAIHEHGPEKLFTREVTKPSFLARLFRRAKATSLPPFTSRTPEQLRQNLLKAAAEPHHTREVAAYLLAAAEKLRRT